MNKNRSCGSSGKEAHEHFITLRRLCRSTGYQLIFSSYHAHGVTSTLNPKPSSRSAVITHGFNTGTSISPTYPSPWRPKRKDEIEHLTGSMRLSTATFTVRVTSRFSEQVERVELSWWRKVNFSKALYTAAGVPSPFWHTNLRWNLLSPSPHPENSSMALLGRGSMEPCFSRSRGWRGDR